MKYIDRIKTQVGIIISLEIIAVIMLFALHMTSVAIAYIIILIINTLLVVWIAYTASMSKDNRDISITKVLGREAQGCFDFGKVGIITYNEQYEVTWISEFLVERNVNIVGKKATAFFEEISELFNGQIDVVRGEYEGNIYEVSRKPEGHVLYVKDVTRLATISKKYDEEALVIGLIHMDNYSDIAGFEDETKIAQINMLLRQPIIEWAHRYKAIIRRLRSDRFLMVLDESIYTQMLEDKFDILNETRNKASQIDVSITLSMSFARGHVEIEDLDEMASELLEMAQSRGGDQVAVKKYGEDVRYYGASSEAPNERSRVRVRVIAQALKEIVDDSNNVFISGHKEMDFDCMGACLAMSKLIQGFGKTPYIVSETGRKESHLQEALNQYNPELKQHHQFISDEEALKMYKSRDLLIAVDYHNPDHSGAEQLLSRVDRLVVVDHHRRSREFIRKPLLVYIESGASSSCELISELISYQPIKTEISAAEATIMYAGILVDTNRFRTHTGFRTFEACAILRKWGVDVIEAESLLKEDFNEFESKTRVYKQGKLYRQNMIIACNDDNEIMQRSLMSMGADGMLDIKGIEASFVIARISENEVAISARSKGNVNVQSIMENMHGGGHFSAAAVQLNNITTQEAQALLKDAIDRYLGEGLNNESNIE